MNSCEMSSVPALLERRRRRRRWCGSVRRRRCGSVM
jgi:hypothetical protein